MPLSGRRIQPTLANYTHTRLHRYKRGTNTKARSAGWKGGFNRFFPLFLAAYNSKMVLVRGRGVQANGVRQNETADFYVLTDGAGEAELQVEVTDPCKCRFLNVLRFFPPNPLSTATL